MPRRSRVAATVASPDAGAWGRFTARCEAERPSPAADVVDAGIGAPLRTAATALVRSVMRDHVRRRLCVTAEQGDWDLRDVASAPAPAE